MSQGGGLRVGTAQYDAAVRRAAALLDDSPVTGGGEVGYDENQPPLPPLASGGKLQLAATRMGLAWGASDSSGGEGGSPLGKSLTEAAARARLAGYGTDASDSSW